MEEKRNLRDKKQKIAWNLAFVLLLFAQILVLCRFGERKAGFHEDELYSFYSTNKTAGLFVNDRQWLLRDDFRNDFVVLEGERFRYGIVKQMQSWDVHPPLYYYILHTVCSLKPGVFSKWLGLIVNIAAYIPCFFLLAYLVYESVTEKETEEKEKGLALAFLVCLLWGFSAAVVSGVMFIRMYQWLTLFVLLCACLHIRALKEESYGASFLIPLAATVFLGIMTQYYYFIFHFFAGAAFCFLLFREKKGKELLLYVLSCGIGFLGAILYYPSALAHIFRGYRGKEAVSEFGNAGNTAERLGFFAGLFNDYVMSGMLAVLLLLICLLWITVFYREKRKINKKIGILLFTCAGYFFTIAKTALLLGETSNRYQLPIYGILVFLLLYFLCRPVEILISRRMGTGEREKKLLRGLWLFLAAVFLIADVLSLKKTRVFFLYEEEAPIMEYVKENRETPVIVFYNEASPDNVWRLSDELMEFPGIYLASQGNPEMLTDEKISQSRKILAYVADYEEKENCLLRLISGNENLSKYQVIAKKGLWTLYEID